MFAERDIVNEQIRKHVAEVIAKEDGIALEAVTDEMIVEFITDSKCIWSDEEDSHRWWNDVFRVVEINGMLIGFEWAETTGDNSARDCGWEFDPKSICLVERKEVLRTIYKRIAG